MNRLIIILTAILLSLPAGAARRPAKRTAADNRTNLTAAEQAFYAYDFDLADEKLSQYLARRSKADEEKDMTDGEDWAERLGAMITLGKSMLDRVENVEIIDSVNVPYEGFIGALRLARSAGRITDEEAIARIVNEETLERMGLAYLTGTAFVTENGEDVLWAAADTASNSAALYESLRLADGTWEEPRKMFDYSSVFGSEDNGNVSMPFLMNDGVTLYFAADGPESLGGLDIFLTRNDGGGFLQPSNIGMPYNSPFNDYLYAIDEENGVGWWVTDRNELQDSVTVYTFIPKEVRVNYSVDLPDLASRARVTSIADTQTGEDRSALLRRLRNGSGTSESEARREFDFALPDGRVLHRLSDFSSPMARNAMKDYLRALKEEDKLRGELDGLRWRYGAGDRSVSREILSLEDRLERMRANLTDLSNRVVTAEN